MTWSEWHNLSLPHSFIRLEYVVVPNSRVIVRFQCDYARQLLVQCLPQSTHSWSMFSFTVTVTVLLKDVVWEFTTKSPILSPFWIHRDGAVLGGLAGQTSLDISCPSACSVNLHVLHRGGRRLGQRAGQPCGWGFEHFNLAHKVHVISAEELWIVRSK